MSWTEWTRRLLSRSVGLKAVMALSGLGLTLWVTAHALGNLLVFAGPELINGYGAALQGSPVLWVQRAGLAVLTVAHVGSAVVVTRRGNAARRQRYRKPLASRASTAASRSMRYGGLALGLYTAYHVAHIYGALHGDFVAGDVHHNVVAGLSDPVAATLYLGAAMALGFHLHHGAWSVFRTLGYDGRFEATLQRATRTYAGLLTLAYVAPCAAALAGWL